MKRLLPFIVLLTIYYTSTAQITTPVINANFGVDAELQANYRYNTVQSSDDWFKYPGNTGPGEFIIDTTGAAALLAQYAADPNSRKIPFYRMMRYPSYTILNNRMLIDGVFIRDYHGSDSTIFASGSNKNGMNPSEWSTPVAQSIPDKNDILDMMVHVRRAGPDPSYNLWLMGGLSIENTTGNRYFDFEMYQTDIYYDRPSLRFYGYGPDAGHTRWEFDAAGQITKPGDIVFTAEYSSSALTKIEARIWIDRASLLLTPQAFSWTGTFDGASNGSQYGYAGILPKTTGDFYTGMASNNNVWAGPFALVRDDNSVVSEYIKGQYMEFSVNLTKLGLDPVTLLGGNNCGMPFRRVLVKTRASTSFTAELKDFVGPFDFFLAPRAQIQSDVPIFCGTIGIAEIQVINPVATSVYTWSTPDGNIFGNTTGTSITADAAGTYIVTQKLQQGCSDYASDTTMVIFEPTCTVLPEQKIDFSGKLSGIKYLLDWSVWENGEYKYYDLERSSDGIHFTHIERINAQSAEMGKASYTTTDDLHNIKSTMVYYRLKISGINGQVMYSKIINQKLSNVLSGIKILTNPVKDYLRISVNTSIVTNAEISIYDIAGRLMQSSRHTNLPAGPSIITLNNHSKWSTGIYTVKVVLGNETYMDKIVIGR
ncbi:MAG: T9SS type A sorting domain-containing protein [Chitinophagaceae bacterium]|nr:T9SS type A sorting domain-containing protein [Chitinophagaceae bacterium]